jgi:transcriptional regulator ATRX
VYGSDTKYFDDSICVFGTIGDKIISVASSLAKKLKPHQIDGCKFMWDQVFGDISNCSQSCDKKLQNAVKSGCILAHNMGL